MQSRIKLKELIIEISKNCNLSCIMCGFGQEKNHKDKFMSKKDLKSILNQNFEADKIRLNGRGESTIHPNFIEIVSIVKQTHPKAGINLFSNLCFNNDHILNCLIDNGVQVFASIDSPNSETLSKIRKGCDPLLIYRNIRKKIAAGSTTPFIVFTLQECNLQHITDIAYFFCKSISSHLIVNVVRRDEKMDTFKNIVKSSINNISKEFEQTISIMGEAGLTCLLPSQISGIPINNSNLVDTHNTGEMSCPAIRNELVVYHNMDVAPCNMFNPYILGNLHDNDLNSIINGEKMKDFINIHKTFYYCENCACLGGTV